jgi:hypothetical protein
MNEDVIIAFMVPLTILGCVIGLPLVRALARRWERQASLRPPPASDERLERIEQAIEAMAVEVERISEGQRFVTRILSERTPEALPPRRADATHS